MCGNHARISWPIYDALGFAYPSLPREQRDAVITQTLGILDQYNWGWINGERGVGHTEGIREPLFLADISIVRPHYWPGLSQGKRVIGRYASRETMLDTILTPDGLFDPAKVHSDFIVAYTFFRPEDGSLAAEYVRRAHPAFLDRTVQGIAALRFGGKNANYKEGTRRLEEILPPQVHAIMHKARDAKNWADYTKFNGA